MGTGGSKMLEFSEFATSVKLIKNEINEAKKMDCYSITDEDWTLLEKIFKNIKVMKSKTTLVGNSKVMAHLLSNIVPPIDRQYTLNYLKGNTQIINNLDEEWLLMKEIIQSLFIPIATDNSFQMKANDWMSKQHQFVWDTSFFKIIDNLIIGSLVKSLTR